MLRCLGYNVLSDRSCPTCIFGDNLSVILNVQNPSADLSKKHVAILCHTVREAVVSGIIEPYWLNWVFNTSDIMTKKIPRTNFNEHVDYIYWRPDFHIQSKNRLADSHMDAH